MKYRVAIIGAGRIGAQWDTPKSEHVLTHAHAFSKDPHTELAGLFDTDDIRAAAEASKWGTTAFASLGELFAARPDIVVIASPDETHVPMFERALTNGVRLVVCEKPIATNAEELARVSALAPRIPVIVNYRRRFDPAVRELQTKLKGGAYGKTVSVQAVYSKGLVHNGVHLIDLARFLFGELTASKKLYELEDWDGGPTVGAFLSFERCEQFYLGGGDARAYSIFEIDILTEKKRFRFTDEGFTLVTEEVVPDRLFTGHRVLGNTSVQTTGLIHSMEELAAHAVAILDGTEQPRASLADAVGTQSAVFRILG